MKKYKITQTSLYSAVKERKSQTKLTRIAALVLSSISFCCLAFSSNAKGKVDYNFDPASRTLITQALICYPGSGAKSKLKTLAPKVTGQGLKEHIKAHEQTLIEQFGVPVNQINEHLFALQLKLKQADYQHEFNQLGNETCTLASTEIKDVGSDTFIDNLDELIPFESSTELFFFGPRQTFIEQVRQLTSSAGLPFESVIAEQTIKTIYSNNDEHYLSFDLDEYQSALLQQRKVVYLTGNNDSVAAVAAYLSDKGFTLATRREQAYWHIDTSLDIIKGNDGLTQIALSLTARHDGVATQFTNQPADMPITNINQATIIKTTAVHLELMSLAQSLLTTSN